MPMPIDPTPPADESDAQFDEEDHLLRAAHAARNGATSTPELDEALETLMRASAALLDA